MPETVSRVQITKLQIGDKRDYKLGQEKLQNGAKKLQIGQELQIEAREITKRGKKITNCGRDYKSREERLQNGAGITNPCKTSRTVK